MQKEPPGSNEIRALIAGLHTNASVIRSRHENEIADYLEKAASQLVVGPAGEAPLRSFASYINHWKGFIDERPSCFSSSEWKSIANSLRKLTNAALTASGWSPSILSMLKRALLPF